MPNTVELRFASSIARVSGVGRTADVVLTDGTEVSADLLVGADGIHSRVRELIFGPEARFLRYLGYHTAAYLFEDETLALEKQRLLSHAQRAQRAGGLLPLGGDRVAAFFAHRAPSPVRPPDPRAELRRVYGNLGWQVPRLLAAAERTHDIYYDVVAQIELPRWFVGRAVLVGDAGYAVSLLAGQGASLALGGAYLLGEAVAG